jgi:hypothetical protein
MGYFLLFTRFSTHENSYVLLSILIGLPVALNIFLENLVATRCSFSGLVSQTRLLPNWYRDSPPITHLVFVVC